MFLVLFFSNAYRYWEDEVVVMRANITEKLMRSVLVTWKGRATQSAKLAQYISLRNSRLCACVMKSFRDNWKEGLVTGFDYLVFENVCRLF